MSMAITKEPCMTWHQADIQIVFFIMMVVGIVTVHGFANLTGLLVWHATVFIIMELEFTIVVGL